MNPQGYTFDQGFYIHYKKMPATKFMWTVVDLKNMNHKFLHILVVKKNGYKRLDAYNEIA